MIKAMYTAAAGMNAQQTEVDVIANNLANVNTNGFKRSQTNFEDLLYVTMRQPGSPVSNGSTMIGLQVGSGARLVSTSKVFTAGTLLETSRPLDIAITGEGFFELAGLNGERFFTRDGHFNLDANGAIVNAAGLKLQPEITIPPNAQDLSIAADGTISYTIDDTQQQAGQLTIVRFVNSAGLSSNGQNLFRLTGSSGDPVTEIPGQNGAGELRQGMIERSNVDVATELIELIIAQRAYEVNSKAISSSDEMLGTVNNMVR